MVSSTVENIVLAPRRVSAPVQAARILRGFRRRNILLVFSVFILLVIAGTGILAPWISPHNPARGRLEDQKLPPAWIGERTTTKTVVDFGQSPDQISISKAKRMQADVVLGDQIEVVIRGSGTTEFLLGTDHLGRDMLSRIIHGARISLIIASITLGVGGLIGTTLGLAAGYFGGWTDMFISRIIEIMLLFPSFFLILTLIGMIGPSIYIIMVVIGITGWPTIARLIRGEVLKQRAIDYTAAAQALGASHTRVIFRHILPNSLAPALVAAPFGIASAIITEAGLSLLGFGVQPPAPTWGVLLRLAYSNYSYWWLIVVPSVAIFCVVTVFNLIGGGLRDAMDPKLRQ